MNSTVTSVIGKSLGDNNILIVDFSNGVITRITTEKGSLKDGDDLPYIAPGLIDNQVNGYKGTDFTEPGLTVDQIRQVTEELWREGVTTYLPTLITCSPEDLIQNLGIFAEAILEPSIGTSIPGIHLEGPYISPEDGYRGAHNKKWTRLPDWSEFLKLREASRNNIRQITLAPELKGAIEFIRKVNKEGIIIALGHHNAPASVITQAVEAGATVSTHLGNGCANLIHRHHNPIWPQLSDDRLMTSIIADGFHLTVPEVRVFYRVKSAENLFLVSDLTKIGGLEPGEYLWNEKRVRLNRSGLLTYPEQDVLAGSSMTLRQGIGNMIRFTGCSLPDAIRMSTYNPAAINHFYDRGTLEVGKRADIILFDYDGHDIRIRQSIVNGEIVYRAIH